MYMFPHVYEANSKKKTIYMFNEIKIQKYDTVKTAPK